MCLLTDKLTKEEEEIYKLQLDLDRMAIGQQQSKKISEVSSPHVKPSEYAAHVALQVHQEGLCNAVVEGI